MDFFYWLMLDNTDLLLRIAVKKLGRKPAENVIHDRLGHRDIGVFGETRRLETHMTELVDQHPEGLAIYHRHRDRGCERVHQTGDRRAFLRHGDKDLAGLAVFIGAGGDITLMPSNIELVGDRPPL